MELERSDVYRRLGGMVEDVKGLDLYQGDIQIYLEHAVRYCLLVYVCIAVVSH